MIRALSNVSLIFITLLSLSSCAKRSYPTVKANDQQPTSITSNQKPRLDLNRASIRDLEELPGIGKGLAARIVEHREKFGPFRRAEHLIVVRGISDRRFRAIQDLVTVE